MSTKESQVKQEKGDSVQIGTLFKFIKPFDGTREKLNSFLTNCDNAIALASEAQKSILFKFVLSQLEGKAETACSIKEFDSWDQLSEFLKTQFGERKHYAHLLTDLQECRQLPNEAVNQFALRLETCLSKLLTEVTLSNKRKSELVGRIAAMEDLALHTFLLGLKPNVSNLVRGKNPSNLNDAVNLAVSEEKILNMLYKRNSSSTSQNSMSQRPLQKTSFIFKPAVHNVNTKPQVFEQTNQTVQNLFCRYCKTQGHVLENCKKREYNNIRFRVPQTSSQFQQRPNQNQYNQNYSKARPARVNCATTDDYYNPSETQSHDHEGNEESYYDHTNDNHLNE